MLIQERLPHFNNSLNDDEIKGIERVYADVRTSRPLMRDSRVYGMPLISPTLLDTDAALLYTLRSHKFLTQSHLSSANETAKDQIRNEFIATLAHELRNPLAPIKGALELMKLLDLSEEAETLRLMMSRQVAQLVHLVEDLSDVSRINCGRITIERQVVSLNAIIATALDSSSTLITENEQVLVVTIPPKELHLFADQSRIAQVITNLLNNAAKYSGAGCHIELNVETCKKHVVITVRDNGSGIEPRRLQNIFTMFTQVGHTPERGPAGLGIGLALVKTFVELHGGTVTAQSDGIGCGSLFTVCLPLAERVEIEIVNPVDPVQTSNSRSFRILVVDDMPALRAIMSRLLEKLGHTVEVAESGAQAIEVLDDYSPEIIFSDVSMPEMSGYELARYLRKRKDTKHVFMVAMTGCSQSRDRALALDSGFDEHMTKPVDLSQLKALFNSLCSKD